MKATYAGSCHCGKVRFQADLDFEKGTGKCNCSICTKGRFWGMMVKPSEFRLLSGEGDLGDYQFGTNSVHHHFCKTCGIRPFGHGFLEAVGGEFYTVNVSCLDDVDVTKLAEAPVRYSDGRNNNWMHTPAETRHL